MIMSLLISIIILCALIIVVIYLENHSRKTILKSKFICNDYLKLIGFRLNREIYNTLNRKVFSKYDKGCYIEVEEFYDCWELKVSNRKIQKVICADVNTTEELRSKMSELMKTK